MIKRHKWSILSLAVTIGMAAAIGGYTQYEYRVHHIRDFSHGVLPVIGGCSVLISVASGVVAVAKEKGSPVSLIALILGLLSFAFYTV